MHILSNIFFVLIVKKQPFSTDLFPIRYAVFFNEYFDKETSSVDLELYVSLQDTEVEHFGYLLFCLILLFFTSTILNKSNPF